MTQMRAKMRLTKVDSYVNQYNNPEGKVTQENLTFNAVSKSEPYPADGSDEDNTFARWTPTAQLTMSVLNPNLLGKMKVGDIFYVDFTPAG